MARIFVFKNRDKTDFVYRMLAIVLRLHYQNYSLLGIPNLKVLL